LEAYSKSSGGDKIMAKRGKIFKYKPTNSNSIKVVSNLTKINDKLIVITENSPYFNSFALGIGIKVGSRDDFIGKEGIAHLLEHCVFRRTKKHISSEINELFEKNGAYANAFTTKEYTLFYVRGLKHNFLNIWDLLNEIVFQPQFERSDLQKEKSIIREEIRSYNEDPEEVTFDYAEKLLFGSSSLSHPILGTITSLNKIQIDDLVQFYDKYYSGSEITISVVGNFEHSYILELVSRNQQLIGELKNDKNQREQISIINQGFKKTLSSKFYQTHLIFSILLPKFDKKERLLLSIASLLIGESASSRLYKTLREKYGLVYNVFSSFTTYSDCSTIHIYSSMNPRKQNRSYEILLKELTEIHKNGFTPNELNLAKEQLKASTIISLENLSERMQSLIKSELVYGTYDNLNETISLIENIQLNELNEFVFNYLNPDFWSKIIYVPK
jgi:predicted Zn-dependent peptidase